MNKKETPARISIETLRRPLVAKREASISPKFMKLRVFDRQGSTSLAGGTRLVEVGPNRWNAFAWPHTFHGNPDRIRRTVGERNVSRIFPSRSADPVPPWRQPALFSVFLSSSPSSSTIRFFFDEKTSSRSRIDGNSNEPLIPP